MTSILFVTSTRIGDCILSTGLYRHLAENQPDARITVACGPLGAPVFRAAPNLTRTIVVAKSPTGHRGHWFKLWREVAGTRWDLIVDLRGSGLAYVLRARARRVFRGQAREPEHKVIELGRVLGLSPPPDPVFWLDAKAKSDAAALIGDDPGPLLAIAPAAAVPNKAWAPERFAQVAARLLDGPMAGARALVLGGPGDAAAAAPLLERLGPERSVDAVGKLDMPAAAAAVARARLYIGADSGLGHAAAAVGAPTLSLFGPTDERRYAPWGPRVKVVRGGAEMADLDVDTVYREASAFLARSEA